MKFQKNKVFLVIKCYLFIIAPILILFFLNNILLGGLFNNYGIHPRSLDISDIFSIGTSWVLHGNFSHMHNNVFALILFIPFIALFERKPILTLIELILISGFFTWLLGANNSIHVGASGLIFAIFGYMMSSVFVNRNFYYLIPLTILLVCFGINFYLSFLDSLIPKDGISFAAHFGGLIAGFLLSYTKSKINKK